MTAVIIYIAIGIVWCIIDQRRSQEASNKAYEQLRLERDEVPRGFAIGFGHFLTITTWPIVVALRIAGLFTNNKDEDSTTA